jgi:CheY-like chemotaxis protein
VLFRSNPSLILLDLNTPQGDGRDALRAIRQNERLRALPLVVLSTSSNPRDVEYCYAAGANAYHTKPVSYPEHLRTLRSIFDYWLTGVVLPDAP